MNAPRTIRVASVSPRGERHEVEAERPGQRQHGADDQQSADAAVDADRQDADRAVRPPFGVDVQKRRHQGLDGLQDERQRAGDRDEPEGGGRRGAAEIEAGEQPGRADDDHRPRPAGSPPRIVSDRAGSAVLGRAAVAALEGAARGRAGPRTAAAPGRRRPGTRRPDARDRPAEVGPAGEAQDRCQQQQRGHRRSWRRRGGADPRARIAARWEARPAAVAQQPGADRSEGDRDEPDAPDEVGDRGQHRRGADQQHQRAKGGSGHQGRPQPRGRRVLASQTIGRLAQGPARAQHETHQRPQPEGAAEQPGRPAGQTDATMRRPAKGLPAARPGRLLSRPRAGCRRWTRPRDPAARAAATLRCQSHQKTVSTTRIAAARPARARGGKGGEAGGELGAHPPPIVDGSPRQLDQLALDQLPMSDVRRQSAPLVQRGELSPDDLGVELGGHVGDAPLHPEMSAC